jgi:hypothetical protein
MALYYQTQYRLGRRGGRVCRSYSGFQAFMAILMDLIFGLLFELVSSLIALAFRLVVIALGLAILVVKLNWRVAVAVMTTVVYILTLPFALLHETIARFKSPDSAPADDYSYRESPLKPEWALSREV